MTTQPRLSILRTAHGCAKTSNTMPPSSTMSARSVPWQGQDVCALMLQTLSTKRHQVTSTRVICAVRTNAVTGWPISGPLMLSRPGPWFLMTHRHKADMNLRRKRCQPSDGCVLAATLVSSSRSISLFLRLNSFTYLS